MWSSGVEIFHFNWLFGLLVNLYPAEVPKSRLRTLHLRGQLNTPHHTYPPLVTLLCQNIKKWRVLTFWTLMDLKFLFFYIIEKQVFWTFFSFKRKFFRLSLYFSEWVGNLQCKEDVISTCHFKNNLNMLLAGIGNTVQNSHVMRTFCLI